MRPVYKSLKIARYKMDNNTNENISSEQQTSDQETDDIFNYSGALLSPPAKETYYEHLALGDDAIDLPREMSLEHFITNVRDQEKLPTCTAFSVALICEIIENVETTGKLSAKKSEMFSAQFIYYHRVNKPENGMYGRNAFQILQKIGTVPETIYPYHSIEKPSRELYKIAKKYRITGFSRIKTPVGVKVAINYYTPCLIVLPIYSRASEFWREPQNQKNTLDKNNDLTPTIAHSVTAIGYNQEGIIIQNSWGDKWSNNGRTILPYSDWNKVLECWVPIRSRLKYKKKHCGKAKCNCKSPHSAPPN